VEPEFRDAVGLDVLVDSMDLFELPGKGVDVAREADALHPNRYVIISFVTCK
jgi:hypothetical protein